MVREMRERPIDGHIDRREEFRLRTRYYEKPVPKWAQLRPWDHGNLASRGYIQSWFDRMNDEYRLTVLTLYVKLWGTMLGNLHIWEYVEKGEAVYPGCLEVLIKYPNFPSFKNSLKASPSFETPSDSDKAWESIEHRFYGALHIKHFEGKDPYKWPVNRVQFHIDEVGWRGFAAKTTKSVMNPRIWIPALLHGLSYDSYKDPYIARKILLGQGWDPEPLLGAGRRIR